MMKRRKVWFIAVWWFTLIPLVACLGLATAAAPPKSQAGTGGNEGRRKTGAVCGSQPRADLPPIDAKALAPRLASLEGKTVYVNGSDANMNAGLEIMLMVARGSPRPYPASRLSTSATGTVMPPQIRSFRRFGSPGIPPTPITSTSSKRRKKGPMPW